MADEERECKCPGCNCFSGLVHVPADGTYVVFPGGRVRKVALASHIEEMPEYDIYRFYVEVADE
jgi:hypothetical protein